MKTITSTFLFYFLVLYGQTLNALNITFSPQNFSCGSYTVQIQTACSFDGILNASLPAGTLGIQVTNISPVVAGTCTLSLLVEPGAPENTHLIFEVISSNDPTGCALAGQTQIVSLVTNCACNLAIEAEFSGESCYQCQNGNIDLIISNGNNPQYSWSNGSNNEDLENLSPGIYTVTITDGSVCEATANFTIDPYICSGFNIFASQQENNCAGGQSASLQIDGLSNMSSSFSVDWNTGLNTFAIDSLTEGTYSVTVTDNDFCTETATFTLTDPPAIEAAGQSITNFTNLTQNGMISIAASGGTGSLTYELLDGNITVDQNTTGNFDNLYPGCYSVRIRDGNLCNTEIQNLCIELECLPLTIYPTVKDESCAGYSDGSIAIDSLTAGISAFTCQWNTGQNTNIIDSLSPGNFTVIVTDNFGCESNGSFTVGGVLPINIIIDSIQAQTSAAAGSIFANATGGHGNYQYLLLQNNDTIAVQAHGTFSGLNVACYQMIAEDPAGCYTEINDVCVGSTTSNKDWVWDKMNIYPNPAMDAVHFSQDIPSATVIVIGTDGKIWLNIPFSQRMDVGQIPTGTYIVHIKDIDHLWNQLLVINRS